MNKIGLALMILVLFIGLNGFAINAAAASADNPFEPAKFGVPNNLGGYLVLAVINNDNLGCMKPGENVLILQSKEQNHDNGTRNFKKDLVKQDLLARKLARYADGGWYIVGPGIDGSEYLKQLQETHDFNQANGCFQSLATNEDQFTFNPDGTGYAVIQNTDAGFFTDDTAQSVVLVAPKVGTQQTKYSGFLNNVMTDTGYFLQVGFGLWNSGGRVIWADTTTNMESRNFTVPVPYVANVPYYTTISFTNGSWWMCAGEDVNYSNYQCYAEIAATGTNLKSDLNTSIWVENWNTNKDWYKGFSPTFQAYNAVIYRNGVGQPWSSQAPSTANGCLFRNQLKTVISGQLTANGNAYFNTAKLPLFCHGIK